jgi:redox-sensitive bicupin YhaK (pirin superfamily)
MLVHDGRRSFQGMPAGMGAPVGPSDAPRAIGPVGVLAHVMPMDVKPGELPVDFDVRPHPHIGLAALTVVLDGHVTHRDSLGNRVEIGPGDVASTLAGRGVVHSERFERLRLHGGRYEQLQILVGLPDDFEDADPSFAYVAATDVPTVDGVRRIADTVAGGAIGFPSALFLHDVTLAAGGRYVPPDYAERAVYVVSGRVDVEGTPVGAQHTAELDAGPIAVVAAEASRILVFGGAPLGPRFMWWNYASSSIERIEAAKAAWRSGAMRLPVGDTESFTPAPPDHGRPLMRLNAALR